MGLARTLMIQGTASHVGKSVLVAALCRILTQDGYRVAPFKAQNMALNSYITRDGGEIGRAQAVQAQAARIEPSVDMNPVLLKPSDDTVAQVIVQGRSVGNCQAIDYHQNYVKKVWPEITASFRRLQEEFEIIVLEGAGSPAEVNLQENDVVNMRAAQLANAPVLLVADIDKGGALAAIVGTLELLRPADRKRVTGLIINKFRGDRELLQPALDFLEQKTGLPVVGVIPYFTFRIPEEDTLQEALYPETPNRNHPDIPAEFGHPAASFLKITVLYLPHISNFTDFDPLAAESDVQLRYVRLGETIGPTDLLIIPGSKNTLGDWQQLQRTGQAEAIINLAAQGTPIIGICGGMQMLGEMIRDPAGVETNGQEAPGLGLLKITTIFQENKLTRPVKGVVLGYGSLLEDCQGQEVSGYEIHLGETINAPGVRPFVQIITNSGELAETIPEGAVNENGLIFGTYLHGLFDADQFRRTLLNQLRKRKGWSPLPPTVFFRQYQEAAFDELAKLVRENLRLEQIYQMMIKGDY